MLACREVVRPRHGGDDPLLQPLAGRRSSQPWEGPALACCCVPGSQAPWGDLGQRPWRRKPPTQGKPGRCLLLHGKRRKETWGGREGCWWRLKNLRGGSEKMAKCKGRGPYL
jgi:hypothetical protein